MPYRRCLTDDAFSAYSSSFKLLFFTPFLNNFILSFLFDYYFSRNNLCFTTNALSVRQTHSCATNLSVNRFLHSKSILFWNCQTNSDFLPFLVSISNRIKSDFLLSLLALDEKRSKIEKTHEKCAPNLLRSVRKNGLALKLKANDWLNVFNNKSIIALINQ